MRLPAVILVAAGLLVPCAAQPTIPATDGLVASYSFRPTDDGTVADESGFGEPLTLSPDATEGGLTWGSTDSPEGATLPSSRFLQSSGPATKISEAARATNQFTVEAWVTPANAKQSGPARIVTLSEGTDIDNRNFTLGQAGGGWAVRLRLSEQGANPGVIEWTTPKGSVNLDAGRQHIVFVYNACPHCGARQVQIHVDGAVAFQEWLTGDLRGWDSGFKLTIGNESTGDRQWTGTIWQLAVYDRALSPEEIRARYAGGQ